MFLINHVLKLKYQPAHLKVNPFRTKPKHGRFGIFTAGFIKIQNFWEAILCHRIVPDISKQHTASNRTTHLARQHHIPDDLK
jgi:hypothetical protein